MKRLLFTILLFGCGVCSGASPDPLAGKIEEVSIFEYGHTPASFEDNYNNLVRNWRSGSISDWERISFTSFRFISVIRNKTQIQDFLRYCFSNDCLWLTYQTDTKYKTFNDEISELKIVIRYKLSSLVSDYYNTPSEEKNSYLEMVREAGKKLTDRTIKTGHEIYGIAFELDGVPRETYVVYDPLTKKIVFSSMFIIELSVIA